MGVYISNHIHAWNIWQELKQNMSDTVDKHQHQLSSLDDVHRRKVAALKASHAKTVDQLQKQLAVSQSSANGDGAAGEFMWEWRHYVAVLSHPEFISRQHVLNCVGYCFSYVIMYSDMLLQSWRNYINSESRWRMPKARDWSSNTTWNTRMLQTTRKHKSLVSWPKSCKSRRPSAKKLVHYSLITSKLICWKVKNGDC